MYSAVCICLIWKIVLVPHWFWKNNALPSQFAILISINPQSFHLTFPIQRTYLNFPTSATSLSYSNMPSFATQSCRSANLAIGLPICTTYPPTPYLQPVDLLNLLTCLPACQMSWKAEIRQQMASMNSRGSHIPRIEEDLVKRRHDELKHAQVRPHAW